MGAITAGAGTSTPLANATTVPTTVVKTDLPSPFDIQALYVKTDEYNGPPPDVAVAHLAFELALDGREIFRINHRQRLSAMLLFAVWSALYRSAARDGRIKISLKAIRKAAYVRSGSSFWPAIRILESLRLLSVDRTGPDPVAHLAPGGVPWDHICDRVRAGHKPVAGQVRGRQGGCAGRQGGCDARTPSDLGSDPNVHHHHQADEVDPWDVDEAMPRYVHAGRPTSEVDPWDIDEAMPRADAPDASNTKPQPADPAPTAERACPAPARTRPRPPSTSMDPPTQRQAEFAAALGVDITGCSLVEAGARIEAAKLARCGARAARDAAARHPKRTTTARQGTSSNVSGQTGDYGHYPNGPTYIHARERHGRYFRAELTPEQQERYTQSGGNPWHR